MSLLYCPVCGNSVAAFLPLPDSYRQQAELHGYAHFGKGETINVAAYSCPVCGASDRERLCALWIEVIKDEAFAAPRTKMIHFSPEQALSRFLKRTLQLDYRSCDITGRNVDDRVDMTDMIYRDQLFDFFICSHVLEHVANDAQALSELFRIMKPGGFGILLAPILTYIDETLEEPYEMSEAERWHHFGQGDHRRLYGKADFVRRIERAGFVVEQWDMRCFGKSTYTRCGLIQSSTLYICRKPDQ